MKKVYETPTAEKISFNYRDQVVVASVVTPEVGTVTNENLGQNGCKLYLLEAYGARICDII